MTFTPRGTAPRDLPPALLRLFSRLRAWRVDGWDVDSEGPTWPRLDREASSLIDADVVSSEIEPPVGTGYGSHRRHIVALDIDYPAHLVESSTPGHFHLYLEVPGGIPHERYMELLRSLAAAKVIQPGYAKVSRERGHSDLRLPWVAKEPYPGSDAAIETLRAKLGGQVPEVPEGPPMPTPAPQAKPDPLPF